MVLVQTFTHVVGEQRIFAGRAQVGALHQSGEESEGARDPAGLIDSQEKHGVLVALRGRIRRRPILG